MRREKIDGIDRFGFLPVLLLFIAVVGLAVTKITNISLIVRGNCGD